MKSAREREQHRKATENLDPVAFNPQDKPLEDLPKVYGFHNGGTPGFYYGQLLALDGTPLGSCVIEHGDFMEWELGVNDKASWRHEQISDHYPDGYVMEYVGLKEVKSFSHPGLVEAIKAIKERTALAVTLTESLNIKAINGRTSTSEI